MLNAMLNGKWGTAQKVILPGDSLRQNLVHSEDMLTSTVFERFAYLNGPLLWEVLVSTFRSNLLPPMTIVELVAVDFWPTWSQSRSELGQAVIPDVVMRFRVGETRQLWVLIVECKLHGSQYAEQWANEWRAFHGETIESGLPDRVLFVALGGLQGRAAEMVLKFTELIHADGHPDFQAVAADWPDLLRVLEKEEVLDPPSVRIMKDLKTGLGLFGFRHALPLSDLGEVAKIYRIESTSADMLRAYRDHTSLFGKP